MRIDGALGLLPVGRQAFRSRWLIRAGIILSAAFHGIAILAMFAHGQHSSDVVNGGFLKVIPVELVAASDEAPRTDAAPQKASISPPAKAAAPVSPDQAAPQFEMHMFSKTLPKPLARQAKLAPFQSLGEPRDQQHAEAESEYADSRSTTNGDSVKALFNPDAVRKQIARCWRLIPGDQKTHVSVSLVLTIAGAIEEPPQTTIPTGEGTAPAILQAIRHAIYTCAPYKLPTDSFNEWHHITLSLDFADTQAGYSDK